MYIFVLSNQNRMPTIKQSTAIFIQNANDLADLIIRSEKQKHSIAYIAGSIDVNSVASIFVSSMNMNDVIDDLKNCIERKGIEHALSRIKDFSTGHYKNVIIKTDVPAAEFMEFERSEKYDDNIERFGNTSNTCECCGKPTAQKLYVHLCTSYEITTSSDDNLSAYDRESQGGFPIGSECAKKFPKQFIFQS